MGAREADDGRAARHGVADRQRFTGSHGAGGVGRLLLGQAHADVFSRQAVLATNDPGGFFAHGDDAGIEGEGTHGFVEGGLKDGLDVQSRMDPVLDRVQRFGQPGPLAETLSLNAELLGLRLQLFGLRLQLFGLRLQLFTLDLQLPVAFLQLGDQPFTLALGLRALGDVGHQDPDLSRRRAKDENLELPLEDLGILAVAGRLTGVRHLGKDRDPGRVEVGHDLGSQAADKAVALVVHELLKSGVDLEVAKVARRAVAVADDLRQIETLLDALEQRAKASLALAQIVGRSLALGLAALACRDVVEVGGDAGGRRVDAHLDPAVDHRRPPFHGGWAAELHGRPKDPLELRAAKLGKERQEPAAEQLVARASQQPAGRLVRIDVAVLPVQSDEALVDLLEHGPRAGLAVAQLVATARLAEAAFQRQRLAVRRSAARHAHLEPAVQAQLQRVHERGDDKQAAAVLGAGVGGQLRVEALDIEAPAVVCHRSQDLRAREAQGDLDIVWRAAVTDGVGAGLLDTEHDVVDQRARAAVLAQVVAHAFTGAQQM